MIKDVMEYSGIVTKIRAMRAKLLKSEDYRKIAAMQTVTEVIYYLKETKSYGKLIDQMDESLYHRGNIEKFWFSHCMMIIPDCTVSQIWTRRNSLRFLRSGMK